MVATAPSTFALITGGGTSGHVVPAIAIIELLVEAGHDLTSLRYVGSDRGAEVGLVPMTGVQTTFLKVDGLQRGMSLTNMLRNLKMLTLMMRASQLATQLLVQDRPKVVVSVGGYASIPVCRAARRLKIPVVTCSYDSQPGLATKLQSRSAAVVAVAYLPSSLPCAQLVGAPVRSILRNLDRSASRDGARQRLGFASSCRLVVVMGGSLGSAVINGATTTLVSRIQAEEAGSGEAGLVSVLHIAGARYMSDQKLDQMVLRADGTLLYQRISYSEQMQDVYAAADLVVARAGASTVAEIATVGVASILIPWKDSAENHQLVNAKTLSEPGGAILVEEKSMTDESFVRQIMQIVTDKDACDRLALAAWQLGDVHRHCSIAAAIEAAV